jgi:hypothetical protein
LCYRIALAAKSLGELFAVLNEDNNNTDFDTPDHNQVEATYEHHPEAQCRLDTYIAAATCLKSYNDRLVPGLQHAEGQNSVAAERQAMMYSCPDQGVMTHRPRCWFKSLLSRFE